jgi:DNA-binding transcriptional regulator YiaG
LLRHQLHPGDNTTPDRQYIDVLHHKVPLTMPNIATVLRAEILRLAGRAARAAVAPVQRASAAHRRQLAALKRQVAALQKELQTKRDASAAAATPKPEADAVRFQARGLISLRRRLGLGAADFGKLVGVSGQSVYHWESKKTTPRKEQVAAIAAVRSLGKRQALAKLALLPKRK